MSAECPVEFGADPRLHDEHMEYLPGEGRGDVALVGVVHDHPASRYRAREVTDRLDPDVLAVEVSPLALPLFEQYASDERHLPALGGEVSAAIAAAEDARVVGIDGVDPTFLSELVAAVREERPDPSTLGTLARSVGGVLRQAVQYRVAAAVSSLTGIQAAVENPVSHDVALTDPPAAQADDERSQLARSLTLLRSLEQPEPVAVRDEVRDRCMTRRVDRLREDGDVLVVVGRAHVDSLADRLS